MNLAEHAICLSWIDCLGVSPSLIHFRVWEGFVFEIAFPEHVASRREFEVITVGCGSASLLALIHGTGTQACSVLPYKFCAWNLSICTTLATSTNLDVTWHSNTGCHSHTVQTC